MRVINGYLLVTNIVIGMSLTAKMAMLAAREASVSAISGEKRTKNPYFLQRQIG